MKQGSIVITVRNKYAHCTPSIQDKEKKDTLLYLLLLQLGMNMNIAPPLYKMKNPGKKEKKLYIAKSIVIAVRNKRTHCNPTIQYQYKTKKEMELIHCYIYYYCSKEKTLILNSLYTRQKKKYN